MAEAGLWQESERRQDQRQNVPYLRLILHRELTALLPMGEIRQVLVISPQQLTVIPNMPAVVMGLLNFRNRVVWVFDLALLLNLDPLQESSLLTIVVLQTSKGHLALALSQVGGVARLSESLIQSPVGTMSAALVPYVKGCCRLEEGIFYILDGEAIAEHCWANCVR